MFPSSFPEVRACVRREEEASGVPIMWASGCPIAPVPGWPSVGTELLITTVLPPLVVAVTLPPSGVFIVTVSPRALKQTKAAVDKKRWHKVFEGHSPLRAPFAQGKLCAAVEGNHVRRLYFLTNVEWAPATKNQLSPGQTVGLACHASGPRACAPGCKLSASRYIGATWTQKEKAQPFLVGLSA